MVVVGVLTRRPTVGRSVPTGRSTASESLQTSWSERARSLTDSCRFQDRSPPRSCATVYCCMTLDPRSELTRQWLQVAADDLRLAELASRADPAMLSGVVYHFQQAFKKALRSIPRTHALPALVVLCQQIDPSFSSLAVAAAHVTPYGAVERRTAGPFKWTLWGYRLAVSSPGRIQLTAGARVG